ALAAEAQLHALLDPGGHRNGALDLALDQALSLAQRTGIADHHARSRAGAAGAGHAEKALLEADLAAAAAGGAGRGRHAAAGALAVAGLAGGQTLKFDLRLTTVQRLLE